MASMDPYFVGDASVVPAPISEEKTPVSTPLNVVTDMMPPPPFCRYPSHLVSYVRDDWIRDQMQKFAPEFTGVLPLLIPI